MTYDLLIFDCDGTLVDSEYMNNLATIELLHEEGLMQYTLDYAFKNFVGLRLKNILASISAETGHVFPADMAERYVRRNRELAPQHLKKIPGAEECVADAARHMKICVASNGQRDNVIDALAMTGLKKYFKDEEIFTAIMVVNAKPAPDLFLLAAEKMGTAPEKCIVIEDSVPGVTGGVAAGMHVLGFTGSHGDRNGNKNHHAAALKKAGASGIYDSFIHIREALF